MTTAATFCRQAHERGDTFEVGMCLAMVHTAFGVASDGTPDATTAWERAKFKHPTTDLSAVPRNAPMFWTGGSHGHGHVAVSRGAGLCWSTDLPVAGQWNPIHAALVAEKWGLTFVGWTEDIDGVRVYTAPRRHPDIHRALEAKPGRARHDAMHAIYSHPGTPPAARAAAEAWLHGERAKRHAMDTLRGIVSR